MRLGYKRAATAVLRLDRQITPLVEANLLRGIPGIGPTTERIARELVYDGSSAFVERAVADAGKSRSDRGTAGLPPRIPQPCRRP